MGKIHDRVAWALVLSTVLSVPAAVLAVDAPQKPPSDGALYSPGGNATCQYPNHARKAAAALPRLIGVAEVEPNDTPNTATVLPLGAPDNDVIVSGTVTPNADLDYLSVNLRRGDVLGVAMNSSFDSWLAITDANGFVLMDNDDMGAVPVVYPRTTPLPLPVNLQQSLDAALSYVVPQDATYLIRTNSFQQQSGGVYTMQVVLRRPYLETQSFFIKQTAFIDFDGATINPMNLYGMGNTSADCSPMRNFLTAWGLTASDEGPLIDKTMAVIKQKYDLLRIAALNGDRPTDGVPGHFDILLHNSKDYVDNFGQPFVTKVIVGGTIQETGVATIGIASSVDPGNFDPQDTALVLLDLLSAQAGDPNSVNSVRLAPGFSKIDAVAQVVGVTAAHELGHTLGNFHTDPMDPWDEVMDAGGLGVNFWAGTGMDGVLGTQDDIDLQFQPDFFDPTEGVAAIAGIVEDVPLQTAFSCSTGKTPGGSGPQVFVFPDLVPMSMQLSGTQLVAGQTFAVSVKIGNAGAAPAGNFLVSLFLNQPTPTSSSAGAASTIAVPNTIDAGEFTQVTLAGTYPAGGDYTLAVLVNADTLIAESNVMNNMLFQPVRVLSQGTDLLISRLIVTEPVPGITAAFDLVVENRGLSAAGPFQVGFYANLGSAPSTTDVPTAAAALAGLGQMGVTSVHFDLPAQSVPRAGYAWFFADCTNAVVEDVETNNTVKASWGVPNNAPVIASTLIALPSVAGIGETVQFIVTSSDPENDPISYVWDFGDGTIMNGGSVATHAFAAPGFYAVRLALSDGPFNVRTASVMVEVVQSVIDLGTVHLSVKRGRFTLNVPRPAGFVARDRLKGTLVSGNPGNKVRFRNFRLAGTALAGQGPQPWQYGFLVEYQSQVTHRIVRLRYRYQVVNP